MNIEHIVLARKPISEKTIADNVQKWGTGGINIDGCRIGSDIITQHGRNNKDGDGWKNHWHNELKKGEKWEGRFPANVILECTCDNVIRGEKGDVKHISLKNNSGWKNSSPIKNVNSFNDKPDIHTNPECPCYIMDEQSGESVSTGPLNYDYDNAPNQNNQTKLTKNIKSGVHYRDKGGASRFFYQVKIKEINENKIKIMDAKLLKGNNLELLKTLEPNSVDSVVTDAPYGLSFMNKKWDYDVPSVEFWTEVYRVLKPGGHILCFGGTRTYHRMVVNIEDAGFEIRDCIQWIYGSGFPKSLNVGKTIDEYKGWGTGLKPANEPIVLARKPIDEDTIAKNVLEYGTGGINIDGCRIGSDIITNTNHQGNKYANFIGEELQENPYYTQHEGRFPANVILECTCDDVIKGDKGEIKKTIRDRKYDTGDIKSQFNSLNGKIEAIDNYNDKGDIHTNPECPCYIMDEQSGESKSNKRINGQDYNKKSDNINIGGGNKNCEYND